jgi:glucose/arabinose dehydrogenase
MRRMLRIAGWTLAVLGVLLAGLAWYASTRITIRGPALHAIAGVGGTQPDAQRLAGVRVPPGFTLGVYAQGLGRVRVLRFTPAGDLLVSATREGKVLLLERDADGDGRADGVRTLLEGLDRPHGLDLAGGWLYVAETGAVRRVRFDAGARALRGELETVATIPGGGMHFTRTLRVGPDGALYVTAGSSCNVCIEKDPRATMLRIEPERGMTEIYADGLRNTVGFDWQPGTGALYGVDNGRDLLGDDFPPDELNRIERGGFYGWPFWHGDNVPDPQWGDDAAAVGRKPIPPAYGFGAHVAALSVNFFDPDRAPPGFENAALVGQHGSWNRSVLSGYRVSSLHWEADGRIVERDFAVGFVQDGKVSGRPVDALPGPDGAAYVSDDYAGAVYRIAWDPERAAPGPVFAPPRAPGPNQAAVRTAPDGDDPLVRLDEAQRREPLLVRGAELYHVHGCATCHTPGQTGSAQPLAGAGARLTQAQIEALLETPPASMPAPPVNAEGRAALAAYLRAAFP